MHARYRLTHRRRAWHRLVLGATSCLVVAVPAYAAASAPVGLSRPAIPQVAGAATATSAAYGGTPWTTPVPRSPALDTRSAAVARYLAGSGAVSDLYAFGVPVFQATGTSRRYAVTCTARWGRCPLSAQPIPIPADARPSSGSDGAMVVVDARAGKVYEFWQARRSAGRWVATWGAVNNLGGTPLGGATGAGIPLLSGLVRLSDVRRGHIDHALTFSSANACAGRHGYPAVKTDGLSHQADCIPEGARVQLDPSVDVARLPGLTKAERMVALALQKYGAYCRDRGGARMAIIFEDPAGKPNPYQAAGLRWDYQRLSHIPWSKLRMLRSWNGG